MTKVPMFKNDNKWDLQLFEFKMLRTLDGEETEVLGVLSLKNLGLV